MKGEQLVGLGLSLATCVGLTGVVQAQSVPANALLLATTPVTPATVSYLFVHPALGNDLSGDGTQQAPLRTITQALRLAQAGTVIVLSPGTYSTVTGERFPLQLRTGIALQGNPQQQGQNILIVGGGDYLSPTAARQNVTLLAATGASIAGVTVTNPNSRGYGLWIESASPTIVGNTFTASAHDGISMTGSSAPLIRGNVFRRNGANGITVYGTSRPEIRENTFEQTGFGINITEKAAPRIIGNRITQNKDGIVVQEQAQPILRNNSIWGNSRDGLVAIAQARPNLGTGSDPGGNLFSNNGRFDLNAQASNQAIAAVGNQLERDRLRGRVSLTGGGVPSQPAVVLPTPANQIGRSTTGPLRTVAIAPPPIRTGTGIAPLPPRPNPVTAPPVRVTVTPPAPVAIAPIPAPLSPPSQMVRPPQVAVPPRPAPPPTGADAIVIPVPPPASPLVQRSLPVRRTPPSQRTATRPALPAPSTTIPVLVPPSNIVRPPQTARVKSPGLLPVPSARIPGSASQAVPPPPAFALAPNVRYRVIVAPADETQQAQIRSLVPTAFTTVSRGRRVLQVGAFSERTKADQLVQMLVANGLAADLEEF